MRTHTQIDSVSPWQPKSAPRRRAAEHVTTTSPPSPPASSAAATVGATGVARRPPLRLSPSRRPSSRSGPVERPACRRRRRRRRWRRRARLPRRARRLASCGKPSRRSPRAAARGAADPPGAGSARWADAGSASRAGFVSPARSAYARVDAGGVGIIHCRRRAGHELGHPGAVQERVRREPARPPAPDGAALGGGQRTRGHRRDAAGIRREHPGHRALGRRRVHRRRPRRRARARRHRRLHQRDVARGEPLQHLAVRRTAGPRRRRVAARPGATFSATRGRRGGGWAPTARGLSSRRGGPPPAPAPASALAGVSSPMVADVATPAAAAATGTRLARGARFARARAGAGRPDALDAEPFARDGDGGHGDGLRQPHGHHGPGDGRRRARAAGREVAAAPRTRSAARRWRRRMIQLAFRKHATRRTKLRSGASANKAGRPAAPAAGAGRFGVGGGARRRRASRRRRATAGGARGTR